VKNSRNLLLVISIILLAFHAPAFAQMGHMKEGGHATKPHHTEMGHEKGMHGASCWMETMTEEQKAKAAKMRLEYKKVKFLLKAQIKVKKVELATLVTQDSPDQSAINKKIEEVLDLKREKMQKKYAFKVAMRSMLTPEQQVSFDMHMLKKALHGKGHGHKKGHGYR
jgi:Spy/CpxP family protein refolding chaperone